MNRRREYKKIRKDYQRKNLKNPFFRKREKGRGVKFWKWLVFLALVITVTLIWFFLESQTWRLKN
ncbi:MAG: hypothetical protein WCT50_04970, partial [Patescibacteria group bacterium]